MPEQRRLQGQPSIGGRYLSMFIAGEEVIAVAANESYLHRLAEKLTKFGIQVRIEGISLCG